MARPRRVEKYHIKLYLLPDAMITTWTKELKGWLEKKGLMMYLEVSSEEDPVSCLCVDRTQKIIYTPYTGGEINGRSSRNASWKRWHSEFNHIL